jgi:hypothetical protein
VAAKIVDWGDVLEVVWTSAAAALGVTLAFSLGLLGAVRAFDRSRAGDPAAAAVYGVLGGVALAAVGGAVVLGITVMASK